MGSGVRGSSTTFPRWEPRREECCVGLGAEVAVVITPDNTITRKCQIWFLFSFSFFLPSVHWFGLCYFPPQGTLVVLGDQALGKKTEG